MIPVAARSIVSLQRSMVLATLRSPASGVYLMQEVCEMAERPDLLRLRRAWDRVAARFPALRSEIVVDGGHPTGFRVHDRCDVEWREVEEASTEDFLRDDRARGFDFAGGIPMRFASLGSTVVWTSHHALLDGRSYVNVWREWLKAYDALAAGVEPEWNPPVPVEPAPPVDEQAADTFWRNLFQGIADTTGYIVERVRSPGESFAKASRIFSCDATARVHAFARECGVSVNNVVQGAWALLLQRYSARNEVVFGVTRAGHRSPEAIGFFIRTVPMRVDLSDQDVRWYLRMVRQRSNDLRAFEQTPMEEIAKYSGLAAGVPPFESVLVYEHQAPQHALGHGGRVFRRLQRTDTPLTLAAYGGPQLSFELVFDTRLFSEEMMRGAADHLTTLIDSFVSSPDTAVRRIRMLTEGELQCARERNRSALKLDPNGLRAHEWFEAQAARAPCNVALDDGGQSVSYRELNERANRIARYLRAVGAGPGDRVGVAMRSPKDAITAVIAVLKSGAAFLPLDPDAPPERFRAMLEDAAPKLVLRELAAEAALQAYSPENLPRLSRMEDPAYAIYTSGSTGKPKSVVVPHRALANHSLAAARAYGIDERDRRLQFASIGTDVFVAEIFNYLCAGAALVLGWDRKGSMAAFWRFLEKRRVTITGVPSAWWNEWVASMAEGAPNLPSSLRAVIIGMEKANPAALRTWKRVINGRIRLFNAYGPTETSPTATVYEEGSSIWEGASSVPIGKPLANTRAYVLDADGNMAPDGVEGQLYIGGAGLALGYWKAPELTAQRFVPDPFSTDASRMYATGDIVFTLPDGNLVFVGRVDRQVKLRGFRVELEEIEAALEAHPAISQGAVIVAGGSQLAAFFVAREAVETAALRAFLAKRLPEHMLPSMFVRLDTMPLTRAGKIDRQALVAPEADSSEERPLPLTLAEKHLAALWEETLEVAKVYTTDHFFELGGDSLRATRLISLIAKYFGREIPLAALWRAPVLASMAAMLDQPEAEQEIDAVVALQPSGSRLPFFALPGADENPYYLWHLARSLGTDQPFYILRDPRPIEKRGIYTVEQAAAELIPHLKSVQRDGPYLLGGHCYGGILAYEMARQLLAAGERVAMLVFLEVPAPGYPKVMTSWKNYLRAGRAMLAEPRAATTEASEHARVLRTLARRKLQAARRRGLIGMRLKNAIDLIERSVHPNTAAGLSYRPRPIDCDLVQFIAVDEPHSLRVLDDPRLAWKDFVRGNFLVRETPGRADVFFRHPHVHVLASRLAEVLDS
ncbi:MAG: amino acid adenylation domain-containing protein, partial [Acidobacteriia bacterium]|nr:amino acid adenylation domain-containing protein [Terriglobia bacterium]